MDYAESPSCSTASHNTDTRTDTSRDSSSTTTTTPTHSAPTTPEGLSSAWTVCQSLSQVSVFAFWASGAFCAGHPQYRKLHQALLAAASIAQRLDLLTQALEARASNTPLSQSSNDALASSLSRSTDTLGSLEYSVAAENKTAVLSLRQACCEQFCRIIAGDCTADANSVSPLLQHLAQVLQTSNIELAQQIVDYYCARFQPMTWDAFNRLCKIKLDRIYRLKLVKSRLDQSWVALMASASMLQHLNLSYSFKLTNRVCLTHTAHRVVYVCR
jgi:hypothetical protein